MKHTAWMHVGSSGLVLLLVWLLWSGLSTPGTHHFHPMLLGFGVASCVFVTWLSLRLKVMDAEGQPNHLLLRGLLYTPWILKEIVKANLDVTRRVLSRGPDISPTIVRVRMGQRTDLGRVIYANSITLTPGTISLFFDKGNEVLTVHAICREGAEDLLGGEMNRRVVAVEGGEA